MRTLLFLCFTLVSISVPHLIADPNETLKHDPSSLHPLHKEELLKIMRSKHQLPPHTFSFNIDTSKAYKYAKAIAATLSGLFILSYGLSSPEKPRGPVSFSSEIEHIEKSYPEDLNMKSYYAEKGKYRDVLYEWHNILDSFESRETLTTDITPDILTTLTTLREKLSTVIEEKPDEQEKFEMVRTLDLVLPKISTKELSEDQKQRVQNLHNYRAELPPYEAWKKTNDFLKQQNPQAIAKNHTKASPYDGKIFEMVVTYDVEKGIPSRFFEQTVVTTEEPQPFTLIVNGHKIYGAQFPFLFQRHDPKDDDTNYCGYYALWASQCLSQIDDAALIDINEQLDNPPKLLPKNVFDNIYINLQSKGLLDRTNFTDFFRGSLSLIAKNRRVNVQQALELSRKNLINISLLLHEEIQAIEKTLPHKISNISKDIAVDLQVSTLLNNYIEETKNRENAERKVFIGNTSLRGSHWFAFTLEKRKKHYIMLILDSLGVIRIEKIESQLKNAHLERGS